MTLFAVRIVVAGCVCPRGGEENMVDGVNTLGESWGAKVGEKAVEVIQGGLNVVDSGCVGVGGVENGLGFRRVLPG